ncbi:MAG: hypothetical protein V3U27_15710 [Candidatus Tectomicrobia bacterium]
MRQRMLLVLSLVCGFQVGAIASAATSPANVVKQFIDAHVQGRFAVSHGLTLEGVNLSASLFSNWLFGASGAGGKAPTADVFLSRRFTQAFRYTMIGTTTLGANQVSVTAVRTSPNLLHLYTWALAPKRGATPYEVIEAIDTYLIKVNFPLEESRMQFTLNRETDEWYISAIQDEKFLQLRQHTVFQSSLSVAPPSQGAALPWQTGKATPTSSVATTTSDDPGRQVADAQFNATMQSFNYATPPPATPAAGTQEDKPSFLSRLGGVFGLGNGGKADKVTRAQPPDQRLKDTFDNIRHGLAGFAVTNNGMLPDETTIHDWPSLRRVVNRYGKKSLPATETAAGIRFVTYRTDLGVGDYTLLVEVLEPQNGVQRVEITPYGVDQAK